MTGRETARTSLSGAIHGFGSVMCLLEAAVEESRAGKLFGEGGGDVQPLFLFARHSPEWCEPGNTATAVEVSDQVAGVTEYEPAPVPVAKQRSGRQGGQGKEREAMT